jgi:hypothetical protein
MRNRAKKHRYILHGSLPASPITKGVHLMHGEEVVQYERPTKASLVASRVCACRRTSVLCSEYDTLAMGPMPPDDASFDATYQI